MHVRLSASATRPQGRERRLIPRAHGPGSLTVTDGLFVAGTVVPFEGTYFAFDTSGTLIGEFDSRVEAVRALPNGGRDEDSRGDRSRCRQ
jgi:hypothetical protein